MLIKLVPWGSLLVWFFRMVFFSQRLFFTTVGPCCWFLIWNPGTLAIDKPPEPFPAWLHSDDLWQQIGHKFFPRKVFIPTMFTFFRLMFFKTCNPLRGSWPLKRAFVDLVSDPHLEIRRPSFVDVPGWFFWRWTPPEYGLPSSFAGASPEPWSSCPETFETQKVETFEQTPGSPPAGSSAGSFLNLEILVETLFASSRVKRRSFLFFVSMRSISVIRARAWSLRTTGHPDRSQHLIFPSLGCFTAHPARDHVMVYPNSASPLRGTIGSTGPSDRSVPFMGLW